MNALRLLFPVSTGCFKHQVWFEPLAASWIQVLLIYNQVLGKRGSWRGSKGQGEGAGDGEAAWPKLGAGPMREAGLEWCWGPLPSCP